MYEFRYIHTTSLFCDCNLKWFLNWIKLKSNQNNLHLFCKYPQFLNKENAVNLNVINLLCRKHIFY